MTRTGKTNYRVLIKLRCATRECSTKRGSCVTIHLKASTRENPTTYKKTHEKHRDATHYTTIGEHGVKVFYLSDHQDRIQVDVDDGRELCGSVGEGAVLTNALPDVVDEDVQGAAETFICLVCRGKKWDIGDGGGSVTRSHARNDMDSPGYCRVVDVVGK